MNSVSLQFAGHAFLALPSGALFWAARSMLVVADLHLGKSERMARRGGALLPPYETTETLIRLAADIQAMRPQTVLCLGDSFDDAAAALALGDAHRATIRTLQAGRRWLWVEGNHDPGALDLGGTYVGDLRAAGLVFRHIARTPCETGEVSGHYHPKARLRGATRPCFITDNRRLMLPAFGAYTGGLDWTTPTLRNLFDDSAMAYLTGRRVLPVPVPRAA